MSRRPKFLLRNAEGVAAVEFAIAVPVLVSMIWGMFQIGIIFQANAGAQHALGEGARYATLCVPTGTGCNVPTNTQIQSMITSHKFGLGNGTWGTPTITSNTVLNTKTITVTYSQPTDFLIFPGPTVSITKSKVVYLSNA
jgi:Flp pilus assembly protein TadG